MSIKKAMENAKIASKLMDENYKLKNEIARLKDEVAHLEGVRIYAMLVKAQAIHCNGEYERYLVKLKQSKKMTVARSRNLSDSLIKLQKYIIRLDEVDNLRYSYLNK